MSTNPNNAVGTNGAFGGRTSVNAFNDVLGVFKSRGIVSGWGIVPDSGMDVAVGGDGSTRDVAIAEDNIGNKTTVNNISQQPVTVSIPAAPASNSRIDLIVAYVDNPAQGVATETDNYGACGLIVVSGASAANPVAPSESDIRTAITTDGGAGSVAYYVVLGSVTVASGTTDISSNMISAGAFAAVKSDNVEYTTLYDNPAGTSGSVQLNGSTVGLKYLEIYYKDAVRSSSVRIADPNGKTAFLFLSSIGQTGNYANFKVCTIGNNTLGGITFNQLALLPSGIQVNSTANNILITKVVGYC